MRSVSSPPTVGSTTISNSVVISSMPTTIARLAMPPSARGTMWPKLRLQPDSGAAGFSHHRASATGNLTMPSIELGEPSDKDIAALLYALQEEQERRRTGEDHSAATNRAFKGTVNLLRRVS